MFLYAENLVSDSLKSDVTPWDFKPTEELTPQIRKSKEDRQNFYQSPATKHYFYTSIEPLNPNLRVNKEQNPPIAVHAFIADYDVSVPLERILEAIAEMKIKPSWIETSLGGNFRLVWILPFPLQTADHDFTVFVLQEAQEWLCLNILPGLDEKAFTTATRLYCNGCEWKSTGHGPIAEKDAQSFFVATGKKYRFNAPDDANVPLDVVEKALKERFPNFNWPGPFELGSQGPSFWVPGSTSPQSAILKEGGLFSFAAHAESPFYPWSKILGAEFVKEFNAEAVTKATKDCYYDKKEYYRKNLNGVYVGESPPDFILHLRGDCGLGTKPGSSGMSPVDIARLHIHNHNGIENAAPFVFQRPGPIMFMNRRRLNTYSGTPMQPSPPGTGKWGPHGEYPFLSRFFDGYFVPSHPQLDHFRAWHQYFYLSALNWTPMAGCRINSSGGVGVGKTFVSRAVVGPSVGGFADASNYLVNGSAFNSHLFEVPLWCLDDDVPSVANPAGRTQAAAMFKKMTANQEFEHNKKYAIPGMVQWMGRIALTTNLDFTSLRILGSLDANELDKMHLFKCAETPHLIFPPRYDMIKILAKELPFYLRGLIEWKVPDHVIPNNRFGYSPYHDPYLLERTHQGSPAAPFTELLLSSLRNYFTSCEGETEYSGTATEIFKMMTIDPQNAGIMRGYKAEQINRYLEQVEKEQLVKCVVSTSGRSRIWTFTRPAELPAKATPAPLAIDPNTPNPFTK